MIYYEEGTFKRYVKEIKDTSKKSKTGLRKVQQLNITGLSKTSKFEDAQKVIIIDYTEFIKHLEDYQTKDNKIKELTQQIEEDKETIRELKGKLDKTPETVNINNKLIELYERLDQKQTVIDNHKNIIIQANDKVNTLIEEVTADITNYFTEEVSQNTLSTQTRVINLLNQIKEVNKSNLVLMENIQTQVNDYNNTIKKTSRFTLFFNKNSFVIPIDFTAFESKKQLLSDFNSIDIEDTAKKITKKFTIDSDKINEIKNNTKSKKLDFNSLFLLDGDTKEDDKDINITSNETQEG